MRLYSKENVISPDENIKLEKKSATKETKETEHTHSFVEIVYVFSGRSRQSIDGFEFEAKRGDLFFVNYNQVHSFTVAEEPFVYVDILIDPRIISEELLNTDNIFEIFAISMFSEFAPAGDNRVQHVHFSKNELLEIETLINNMIYEFQMKRRGYVSVLSGYTKVLLFLLLRVMGESVGDDEKYLRSLLPEILEYINAHCNEKISLTELADKCFYNPSYFSHAFKKYCGKSLSQYIKEKRIENAVELLRSTDYSVSRIAELVGYEDKALFYKMFREITGETPSSIRDNKK